MAPNKSHVQLYADECFPVPSVTHLKSLGYSVVHAFDYNLKSKGDHVHLKKARNLDKVLITLDRDFLYYDQVNLDDGPGVIVISAGSLLSPHINKVCEKLLKQVSEEVFRNSLVRVTIDKLIKSKHGKVAFEQVLK